MNFRLLIRCGAVHGRCTSPLFHQEAFIGASISIIASAWKSTSTLRPIADALGRLATRSPPEAYDTSTTLFTTAGAIAFGYSRETTARSAKCCAFRVIFV